MASESPNQFKPPKPQVTRFSSKVVMVVVILGGLFVALLTYSIFTPKQKRGEDPAKVIEAEHKALILSARDIGDGIMLPKEPPKSTNSTEKAEPMQTSGIGGIQNLTAKANERPQLIVNVPAKRDPLSEEMLREREQLRKMKQQAELMALSAPMSVRKNGQGQTQAVQLATAGTAGNQGPDLQQQLLDRLGPTSEYDPAADKDKEAFFGRANAQDAEWTLPGTRVAGKPFEVKTGSIIPGVMVTGINSDLPGAMIAQVSQNVFDTANGRHLLIPQGSKLYGLYDSRVIYGQERVLIAWNRLIFPDGSSITLGSMPGADMAGYAGFTDQVNNHYLRIFGSAILMSLITGGTAYGIDSMSGGGTSANQVPTMQDQLGTALAQQLGQTTMAMLQKNLNIKPTLEIRPGYQFNVIVTKDMVFKAPYREFIHGK